MLRACSFYLPVTIPDAISVYGMPRLLRWVKQIPTTDRPRLLGYVLNAINRSGGLPGGKTYSQQAAEALLARNIQNELEPIEKKVLGNNALIGVIPRLDVIARFLSEKTKFSRLEFKDKISGQPTIEECLTNITKTVLKRIDKYHAQV